MMFQRLEWGNRLNIDFIDAFGYVPIKFISNGLWHNVGRCCGISSTTP